MAQMRQSGRAGRGWKPLPLVSLLVLALPLVSLLVLALSVCAAAQAAPEGGLNARRATAQIAGRPQYVGPTLTVECWARLTSHLGFNILVASEAKASATHWELFTWPESGCLTAYLPGRSPNHVRTQVDICDGNWHYVAMVMEPARVRLYVDGSQAAEEATTGPLGPGLPDPLVVGGLVRDTLPCVGDIRALRLSSVAREVGADPGPHPAADDSTVGLWDFSQIADGACPDPSPLANAAQVALDPGRSFGADRRVLDATRGYVLIGGRPEYSALPLTVECWAQLNSKTSYNILVGNETKASSTHWELFTMPGTGLLTAYMPGRSPDHCRTSVDIVDGKWHYVAAIMEQERVRLFVDGEEKATLDAPLTDKPGTPGDLAVGGLPTGDIGCVGLIDEVRLSAGVRAVDRVPEEALGVELDTVALWGLDEMVDGKYPDRSPLANPGTLKGNTSWVYDAGAAIPGGMPTEYQPLPPAEDAAPLREALDRTARELGLASVDASAVRDGVLQAWSHEYAIWGQRDYADARPSWVDPEKIRREVYDTQALVWESDGGPLGTVLRRTTALAERLARMGKVPGLEGLRRDLAAVKAAADKAAPERDSAPYRGLFLAACAVRRQIALSNPLLDFDALLFAAHGTFAGSVRSNPGTGDYQGGHFVTQYFGFDSLPGGGLFVVRDFKTAPRVENVAANSVVRNGRYQGQKLDHGSVTSPSLSYDGKRIVFAWTANAQHKWTYSRDTCWHLFRVNVDGTDLVQLTDGAYNDFNPCWLPNGRVAFVSERRGGYIRCFSAYLKVRNYTLFSMKDDGSDIVPLSYYETSEWNPSVNNQGQLVYTRWDYTDRENCLGTRIWISGPDGTDPRAPHGNYPLPWNTFADHKPWAVYPDGRESDSRMGAPLVEMGIRAVPNSPLYVCTAAPHHGEIFGSLAMLDIRQGDDGHMSQVRRFTPDETFPETEMSGRRHYRYGTPWPLSEDFVICNEWETLVLVDRFGNRELLCELPLVPCVPDERLRLIHPTPLRATAPPPVLPQRTWQGESAAPDAPQATVAVMNVYESDQPWPPGTKIKWLRVTQDILKENHAMGEPMVGYERENTPRIPLGVVPVEDDGSVYFQAPVAKELIFQALDENFMAVQSMRSTAFVHPGEQLTCTGCHEPKHQAPPLHANPRALRRAPSRLQPELGPVEPISYYRQIKPIFDHTCLPCHQVTGKGPQDMSYEALREKYTFWFSGAMYTDMANAYSGVHGGSRTIPGRFGARASLIGQAMLDDTHREVVTDEERRAIVLWLDSNSLRLGAYTREEAQLRGELVWPTLDVDPANLLGLEGQGAPLRHNFWHENLYGPHAFLASEHVHDRVVICNEQGQVVWDYSVPHPQDVWMLPNGNILTTYYQGVREVTRDKQIVWEYKTQAPNEIPNCQPLPDGNVLIGIVGECRLIEVNREGEIVREVQLETSVKEPHAQFRMCRKTPEGTYLVPFTAEGAVREYDTNGKVIRTFPPRPSPVCAVRLEDGHTLITAAGLVTEYDRNLNVVWELGPNDIPDINIGVLAGIQRLPNGDTVVCNWNTQDGGGRDGAHIFEVTPDKRVVWQVMGTTLGQVAQCQLLNADLSPRDDIAWR
jgi:hypothetical protein